MFGKILVKVIGASVARTVTATKPHWEGGDSCVKSPPSMHKGDNEK